MAISIDVTCRCKHKSESGALQITHIGGQYRNGNYWTLTEKEAIAGMECHAVSFTFRREGRICGLSIAEGPKGHKRLRAGGNEEQGDYLFHLPDCPETS